ncbi:unnamed protein product [Mytilus edulis]|uniref:Uncharacterized protein n=1 Tax=Mytilus edulis TaxID=6550 RepID=A0A8S3UTK9_MYTED|nr:unnamed protein product [Mytilus edulis]
MDRSVQTVNTSLQGLERSVEGGNTTLQDLERSVQGGNTTLQGLERSVQGGNTTLQGLERSVQGGNTSLQGLERSVQGGNTTLQGLKRSVQGGYSTLQEMNSSIQTINTAVQGIPVINDAIQKLVFYAKKGETSTSQRQNPDIQRQERKSYKLGQHIFYQIHQFSTVSASTVIPFNKAVITNDGHVAFIQKPNCSILIYKTDGSHVGTIQQQSQPLDITVVDNSTVAVALPHCSRIDIWDINNKQKVKSIQLSTKCYGITTINNKLAVGCKGRLLIIDPKTEMVERLSILVPVRLADCVVLVMVYFTQMDLVNI